MKTKKLTASRLQALEELLGAASNPTVFNWDELHLIDSPELERALMEYQAAYRRLSSKWYEVFGKHL